MTLLASSPRARAFTVLYTGGWLALFLAAVELYAHLPAWLALVVDAAIVSALVACVVAIASMARTRRTKAVELEGEVEPGVEALTREWRRVGMLARESFAQNVSVLPLLMLVGILLLIVMQRIPPTFGNQILIIVFGLGYVFACVGSTLSAFTMMRETARIASIERKLGLTQEDA
jgi:hypothetical protein